MKLNRTMVAVTLYTVGGVLFLLSFLAGCSLDRILPVHVPEGVRQELELDKDWVSLREAPRVRERYLLQVTQNTQALDENTSDMSIIHGLASSGIEQAIGAGTTVLGGVGGGGLLALGITNLAALFTKRPKDKTPEQVQIERDLSYDQGVADAKRTIQEQLQSLGLRLTERAGNAVIDKVAEKVADKVVG